jgi:hypothetical protein
MFYLAEIENSKIIKLQFKNGPDFEPASLKTSTNLWTSLIQISLILNTETNQHKLVETR